jgi:hypothetical protein
MVWRQLCGIRNRQGGAGDLFFLRAGRVHSWIGEAAKNQSVILEFKVADVDAEYRRLRGMVKTWVKPPTTQPWGTRSIYFRDPDGNLVDFYSPAPAPESRIHIPFAQTVVAHREFTENRSQKEIIQIRSGASTETARNGLACRKGSIGVTHQG